jgi:drug/metabolite transporter (DMT)-like permease
LALSPNLRGALFMSVSMAGFTANDAITKLVSESMNMAQIMLVRGFFATMLIGLLALGQGALRNPRLAAHPLVALRVAGELCATVAFLMALSRLPLANVSAVLQALPLAVTMGAAMFLGERVGWRRWLAITAGFVGVLIIVRPGFEGFNAFSLLALLCVGFCAIRDIATKNIPHHIPNLLISTATAAGVTIAGAVLVQPFGGWTPMSGDHIGMIAAAAVLLVIGYHFIIMSLRVGDISYIAPFRYTALLWAIVLGMLMFGDYPDWAMLTGATIIVASGLYTLYRERVRGQLKPAAESTSPAMAPDGL